MHFSARETQYGEIFGGTIKEIIGHGSNGRTTVYLLVQKRNKEYFSALKVIPIIVEYKKKALCPTEYIGEYEKECNRLCAEAEKEVQIMDALKGCPNVIYYEEFQFKDWEEDAAFGCDLMIKMPRFDSIFDLISRGYSFSEEEVIKVGKDICTALLHCHQINILHRDIKVENIFRNEHGVYLLGDFGISRILDKTQMAVTGIGTFQYAAPEQLRLEKYDKRVDIYSLGLVLYVLSNRNRLPFAEQYNIAWDSKEIARRVHGEPLPSPQGCGEKLSNVILKACAFRKEQRYQSAEEFYEALDTITVCTEGMWNRQAEEDAVQDQPADLDQYETQLARPGIEHTVEEEKAAVGKDDFPLYHHIDTLDITQVAQLASQGEAAAQYLLAECYHDGIHVAKDNDKAVEWYRRAASNNNAAAQFGLAVCYIQGDGVSKDTIEAIKLIRRAAEQGFHPAEYYLGECCYAGFNGIVIDYSKAAGYFRKAALAGISEAQVRLGDCYLRGHGTEKSRKKAVIWYRAAFEQGNSSARERLIALHEKI